LLAEQKAERLGGLLRALKLTGAALVVASDNGELQLTEHADAVAVLAKQQAALEFDKGQLERDLDRQRNAFEGMKRKAAEDSARAADLQLNLNKAQQQLTDRGIRPLERLEEQLAASQEALRAAEATITRLEREKQAAVKARTAAEEHKRRSDLALTNALQQRDALVATDREKRALANAAAAELAAKRTRGLEEEARRAPAAEEEKQSHVEDLGRRLEVPSPKVRGKWMVTCRNEEGRATG